MREEKLKELLNELADATVEPVRPGLTEDIKRQIPQRLRPHRGGMDTINIIIDLRINKLAAAAAIIITVALCANFLGGQGPAGEGIYQDSKLLAKYWLSNIIRYEIKKGRKNWRGKISNKQKSEFLSP